MSSGRLRARLEPKLQTTQKLSIKLLKYGTAGFALIGLVVAVMVIYGNLGVTQDTLAKNKSGSSYSETALQFDGKNDFVSLGEVKGEFSNTFSVMAWVKWDIIPSTGNPWANIISINSVATSDEGIFWLQHSSDNSHFEFAVQTEKGRTYVQSSIKPAKGVWYHVAGVYNGSTIKIYVNGVEDGSTSLKGDIPNPSTKDYEITIGEWANKDNNYRRFAGVIDEVSILEYPMTANDVRKYMATKVNDKDVLVNFYLDEASGNKISSSNNNKYKGTITGADWVYSGAPVSGESTYQAKNNSQTYEYTFSNGYTLQIINLSENPEGVLFYFLGNDFETDLSATYPEYTFTDGVMGVYVISKNPVAYTAKFTKNNKGDVVARSASSDSKFMVLSRASTDITLWNNETGVSTVNQFDFNPLSSQLETSIGELSISLPIVLEYFRGNGLSTGEVLLEWATASEENNDFFTIERSADGKEFEELAEVDGAGNSKQKLTYSYTDQKPLSGFSYYRLKQTDYDRHFEYSPVISISGSGTSDESAFSVQQVYPNPFVDRLTVELNTPSNNAVNIKLVSQDGNVVYQESFSPVAGSNSHELSISSGVQKGIYLMTFAQAGQPSKVVRVMKN